MRITNDEGLAGDCDGLNGVESHMTLNVKPLFQDMEHVDVGHSCNGYQKLCIQEPHI